MLRIHFVSKMKKEEMLRALREQKFSPSIIKAFEAVNREDFIPEEYKLKAYKDIALPIGFGQTITQPYTIAFMLSLLDLRDGQKILEVGSGSGYVLALINQLSKDSEIYGVEIVKELTEKSREVLENHENIRVVHGDGSKGLKSKMPFDRILVSASADEIPQKLVQQLVVGGILVAPVRSSIVWVQKQANENKIREFPGFAFVPLVEK